NLQVTRYQASASGTPESVQRIAFSILGVLGFTLSPVPVHSKSYWGVERPERLYQLAGADALNVMDCTGPSHWLFSVESAYPRFSNTEGTILISCVSKSLLDEVMRRYMVWRKVVIQAAEVEMIPWLVERDNLIGKF